MAEAEVCYMVALSLDNGLSLLEDVFEDGDGLVARTEYPRIGTEVGSLPLAGNLLVGEDITHHTLMADVGQ